MEFITFAKWIKTAPEWIKGLSEGMQKFMFQLYQTFIFKDRWTFFLKGLKITFIVTIGALLLGTIIGLIVAMIRTAHDSFTVKKPPFVLRIMNVICNIYLAVIRGTPMMVQLLIMGFVIMIPKTDTSTIICGVITLGINSGAYVAEIVRSGLMSIDKGQNEAGRSLGFNYIQTMWHIVIPQAVKNILPTLGNEFIALIKETSVVSFVGAADLYVAFNMIGTNSYEFMVPYLAMAIIYIVIIIVITLGIKLMERGLRKSDRRN